MFLQTIVAPPEVLTTPMNAAAPRALSSPGRLPRRQGGTQNKGFTTGLGDMVLPGPIRGITTLFYAQLTVLVEDLRRLRCLFNKMCI